MIKRPFVLLIAVFLLCSFAHAQGIPASVTNNATAGINYLGWITDAVDELITAHSDHFLQLARVEANIFATIGFLLLALRWAAQTLNFRWHEELHVGELYLYGLNVCMVMMMLHYYSSPLPHMSVSLHQFFPAVARSLSTSFDTAIVNDFLARVNDVVINLEKPAYWNMVNVILYFFVILDMGVMDAALFVIDSFGFIAVGVLTVFGPLFIPCLLLNRPSAFFWRWFQLILSYSMYRAVASAFTFIWATMMVKFFDNTINGDYSLGSFLLLASILVMLTAAFLYSMFKVPAITAELFQGAGALGSDLANGIKMAVTRKMS